MSHTYFAITCEVEVAVGCVLANMYKNVESVYPYSMFSM